MIPTPSAAFSPLTMQNAGAELLAQRAQAFLERTPARRADDVPDEEDFQRTESDAAGRTDSDTLLPASCV